MNNALHIAWLAGSVLIGWTLSINYGVVVGFGGGCVLIFGPPSNRRKSMNMGSVRTIGYVLLAAAVAIATFMGDLKAGLILGVLLGLVLELVLYLIKLRVNGEVGNLFGGS